MSESAISAHPFRCADSPLAIPASPIHPKRRTTMGDSADDTPHPPNLVHSNPNLPRSIRARTGATTDPIPHGKKLDAHPQHHHAVVPADHDKHAAAITEAGERTAAQEREDRKAHVKEMQHARNEPGFKTTDRNPVPGGADSGKQASVGNKIMDSRKAHGGVMQSNKN